MKFWFETLLQIWRVSFLCLSFVTELASFDERSTTCNVNCIFLCLWMMSDLSVPCIRYNMSDFQHLQCFASHSYSAVSPHICIPLYSPTCMVSGQIRCNWPSLSLHHHFYAIKSLLVSILSLTFPLLFPPLSLFDKLKHIFLFKMLSNSDERSSTWIINSIFLHKCCLTCNISLALSFYFLLHISSIYGFYVFQGLFKAQLILITILWHS